MKEEGLKVMQERFGKDNVIVLGTIDGEYPAVRQVNGYYEDGAFSIITYALSCAQNGFPAKGKQSTWAILEKKKIGKWQKSFARHLPPGLTTDITISMMKIPLF